MKSWIVLFGLILASSCISTLLSLSFAFLAAYAIYDKWLFAKEEERLNAIKERFRQKNCPAKH